MPDAAPRPEPFNPQAAPAALEDLRARLRATRWPDAPEDAGLVARHRPRLPPRARRLLGGRVRLAGPGGGARPAAPLPGPRSAASGSTSCTPGPPRPARRPALPLVLSHGWPDSFWRYAKVIPLLTDPGAHGADPADAFDVVVPDMPGFGYSDRPAGPPLDSIAVAGLWAELMERPRLRPVRRGRRGHRQPREPLPRARPPRPGGGRPSDGRGPTRLRRRPGRPRRPRSVPGSRTARPGARPRAPTPPCTAPSRRPPPSG